MGRKSHEDALGVAGAETVIGTGVRLKGNLKTESDLAIDGQLQGDISADGDVSIGVNARIHGNVTGRNITIAGEVEGNVQAQEEISILATGQIRGDLRANALSINSGGIFIGNSRMDVPGKTSSSATGPSISSHQQSS